MYHFCGIIFQGSVSLSGVCCYPSCSKWIMVDMLLRSDQSVAFQTSRLLLTVTRSVKNANYLCPTHTGATAAFSVSAQLNIWTSYRLSQIMGGKITFSLRLHVEEMFSIRRDRLSSADMSSRIVKFPWPHPWHLTHLGTFVLRKGTEGSQMSAQSYLHMANERFKLNPLNSLKKKGSDMKWQTGSSWLHCLCRKFSQKTGCCGNDDLLTSGREREGITGLLFKCWATWPFQSEGYAYTHLEWSAPSLWISGAKVKSVHGSDMIILTEDCSVCFGVTLPHFPVVKADTDKRLYIRETERR